MKLFLPVFKNHSFDPICTTEAEARNKRPKYNYIYDNPNSSIPKVLCFLAVDIRSLQNYLYSEGLPKVTSEKKIIVAPPLLNIRVNSKTFPSARKVAYCAIKGFSPQANPFVVVPGVVGEDEEFYEDEE